MADTKHPFYEDALAIFTGTLFVALGLSLFENMGLLIGGTAGMALLLTHVVPINFGVLFFLINLPFYFLAWRSLGKRFTINTFVAVAIVSLITENMYFFISFNAADPIIAAIVGGLMIGMGLLALFRHNASLGGIGILAFYLQSKYGFRAGKVQLVVDSSIVLLSLFILSPLVVFISVLGAVAMNLILAINHKPGRYQTSELEETNPTS